MSRAPASSGLLDTISCCSCHPLFATATSAAAEENCLGCHPDWDASSLVLDPGMHKIHVATKRADCLDCHLGSPHKELNNNVLSQMNCYECHGEDRARFAAQVAVYTGRALGFTEPDPMAVAGVACSACHEQHASKCADGKSACTKCHVAGYDKIVAIWQKTTRIKLARLMGLVNKAIQEGAIEEIPLSMQQFLKVLKEDGSFGVHNIHAVNDLLDRGLESMLSLLPEEGR